MTARKLIEEAREFLFQSMQDYRADTRGALNPEGDAGDLHNKLDDFLTNTNDGGETDEPVTWVRLQQKKRQLHLRHLRPLSRPRRPQPPLQHPRPHQMARRHDAKTRQLPTTYSLLMR